MAGPLWGYFIVILSIVLPWFFKSGYLFFTDHSWGPNIKISWIASSFLLNLSVKILSFILPVDLLEKLYISGIIALILFGGRSLVRSILRLSKDGLSGSTGLVFVLSLFTLFNPFVYDRALFGQFDVLAAYGFFLFTLASLIKAWHLLEWRNLLQASVYFALTIMFSRHFIFLSIPFSLLFLSSIFCKRRDIAQAGLGRMFAQRLFLGVALILALNANWLFFSFWGPHPTARFVSEVVSVQDLNAFQTSGKTTGEIFSNVVFMSGFWGKDQYRYADLTDTVGWQKSFIFLFPLIVYGIYLSFRSRSRNEKLFSVSLLVIYVTAVVLAVGTRVPLTGPLVAWLYENLPLYKGLREPQKWVMVIIPIYIFYLTLAAARWTSLKSAENMRWLAGIIIGSIVVMQAPLLIWGFGGQIRPTPYPADWVEADESLVNRAVDSYGCSDRILFLPWHLYMNFFWSGKVMANPAQYFFTCPTLSGTNMEWAGIYGNSLNPDGAIITDWIRTKGREGPPGVGGKPLRYIILAKEVDFTAYLWLNRQSYLEIIKETTSLIIYEIKN